MSRRGSIRRDDVLPDRVYTEPMPNGSSAGHKIRRRGFEEALAIQYELRGWHKDGIPTKEKLAELGLDKAAEEVVV